ncbi:hypothetical protein AVEN_93989-1 [Araneus ventricosus]|uniref:Uncharacterized protein n=1 Tax=Araneus ventricosus TaxID=182803 RepID=A0A4Y2CJK7_ARAVE|nr:hypothetical protein AVEN_93989-1 [Araneus ventricosus]
MRLNRSRWCSSSGDVGIVIVITGYDTTTPVGGTQCHRQWTGPSHYCTRQGNETPHTSPAASHPVFVVLQSGTDLHFKMN